jgi:hypothetical protein
LTYSLISPADFIAPGFQLIQYGLSPLIVLTRLPGRQYFLSEGFRV